MSYSYYNVNFDASAVISGEQMDALELTIKNICKDYAVSHINMFGIKEHRYDIDLVALENDEGYEAHFYGWLSTRDLDTAHDAKNELIGLLELYDSDSEVYITKDY